MIHVTSTDIETIWAHAKNIRADFVRHFYNGSTVGFVNREDCERNYNNMFKLLSFDESQNIVNSTEIFNDIPEETMKNGALVWYFLNLNPIQPWRNYWVKLFENIIGKDPISSILLTNQIRKKSSTIAKEMSTHFLGKLASLIGLQYNFSCDDDNVFGCVGFSRNISFVGGNVNQFLTEPFI